MPTGNTTPSHRWPILAGAFGLLLGAMAGCTPPRTVEVQSMADPEMHFPAPEQALVHVAVVRVADEADADNAEPTVVARDRLTLAERNFIVQIERGMRAAGFPLVSRSEAEFILYGSSQTVTGERQGYRRMPVYETAHGSIHTRRGWRTFHGTTTSEVVVPVTRRFAERTITLTAHRALPGDDWPQPHDESAVWMGRLFGEAEDMEDRVAPMLTRLLSMWGRTAREVARVDQLTGGE